MPRRARALLRYADVLVPGREPPRMPDVDPELVRWMVRGDLRRREEFGRPHPADFPGGLPLPPECPRC